MSYKLVVYETVIYVRLEIYRKYTTFNLISYKLFFYCLFVRVIYILYFLSRQILYLEYRKI